ncbi:MAG: oligosaccharide flippase family protein [Planctomycetes bacterium]|nr:oligosaccharide flippase family protein [Planctomycetota bacterium]MCP4771018.1 oligosaccharide flippase family protein [Planctomycetota bacterium]MCP4861737.1 oligosaccharide flippase family protein [Planctomycetota bacterium]
MTEPAKESLAGRGKRGGMWVLLGKGFETGLRLVSSIIMTWLLFREAFGVLVPVHVFLTGIQLFSDIGIGPSIVHSKRGEETPFLRTVWTIQVIRGILLYGVCWALAKPYALMVGEVLTEGGMAEQEMIEYLLVVAGSSALILGFRSPSWFTLDRQIAQGRKTLIQALSLVISVATMIIWALISPTPMALVAGGVSHSIAQTLFSHIMLPGVSMRFQWEKKSVKELFSFGRWIFLSTAYLFFAMQVERILITKLMETGDTGDFGIAYRIAGLVPAILLAISGSVVFPVWMESFRRGDKGHTDRVQRSRLGLLSLCIAGLIGVVTVAPTYFTILYRDEYIGAALIAQLLCIPFWFSSLIASCSKALLVHGDSRSVSTANLVILLVKMPACWFGFKWLGLPGFILGMALGNMAGLLSLHLRLISHGTPLLKQDVVASLALLVFGGAGYFISEYSFTLAQIPGTILVAVAGLALAAVALQPARALIFKK